MSTPLHTPDKKKQSDLYERVLYDIVSPDFILNNLYSRTLPTRNARAIVELFNCKLEYRDATFKDLPGQLTFGLEKHGISKSGKCKRAVVLGEDQEKIIEAIVNVYSRFGVEGLEGITLPRTYRG